MGGSAGRSGAGAYAALVEWENHGRLAALAPGLADRIAVAEASAGALARYRAALDRLIAADQEPAAAMAASVRFVDAARARVAPSTWWEALVVAVAWVPLVEVSAAAAELEVFGAGADGGDGGGSGPAPDDLAERDGWAVWRVREAVQDDPALGARLALWGRRLGGEAIALAAGFTGPGLVEAGARKAISGGGAAVSAAQDERPDDVDRVASFAALADRVAQAHASALVALFGQPESQPA